MKKVGENKKRVNPTLRFHIYFCYGILLQRFEMLIALSCSELGNQNILCLVRRPIWLSQELNSGMLCVDEVSASTEGTEALSLRFFPWPRLKQFLNHRQMYPCQIARNSKVHSVSFLLQYLMFIFCVKTQYFTFLSHYSFLP